MQIKKRNCRTARRSSRKAHSRTAYHKSHSRNNCRSARRRMGGRPEQQSRPRPRPTITVHQPMYDDFVVAYSPDIEAIYAAMLNHQSNHYSQQMAQSYADQQNVQYSEYVFVPDNGFGANIVMRDNAAANRALEARLQQLELMNF